MNFTPTKEYENIIYLAANLNGKSIYDFHGNSFLRVAFKSYRKLSIITISLMFVQEQNVS